MKNSNQFLSSMRDRYGISEEFVSAGRPFIDAIYAEFDDSQRANLLEFAESVFAQQAMTEKTVRTTASVLTQAARDLERAFADLMRLLVIPRKSVVARTVVDRPVAPRLQLN
jgi:hypothetical protein